MSASRCDRCGAYTTDLDAGFSPAALEMGHDCGGTWRAAPLVQTLVQTLDESLDVPIARKSLRTGGECFDPRCVHCGERGRGCYCAEDYAPSDARRVLCRCSTEADARDWLFNDVYPKTGWVVERAADGLWCVVERRKPRLQKESGQ